MLGSITILCYCSVYNMQAIKVWSIYVSLKYLNQNDEKNGNCSCKTWFDSLSFGWTNSYELNMPAYQFGKIIYLELTFSFNGYTSFY